MAIGVSINEFEEDLILLDNRLREIERIEEWADDKTAKYILRYPQWNRYGNNTLEDLVGLFREYKAAQERKEKLSLQEFSERSKWSPQVIGRIFARVDVDPMYRKVDRHITPKHKKDAMRRAVILIMSSRDIGFFLGVPGRNVNQNWNIWGLKKQRPKVKEYPFGKIDLQYRTASVVYEEVDMCDFGNSRGDVAEIFGIRESSVNYLLENRRRIETKIMSDLRVLYDDETIDKPYKRDFD